MVTPGLFDSVSQLGLVEVNAVEGSADAAVEDDRITAAFDVADALNPRSSLIPDQPDRRRDPRRGGSAAPARA